MLTKGRQNLAFTLTNKINTSSPYRYSTDVYTFCCIIFH